MKRLFSLFIAISAIVLLLFSAFACEGRTSLSSSEKPFFFSNADGADQTPTSESEGSNERGGAQETPEGDLANDSLPTRDESGAPNADETQVEREASEIETRESSAQARESQTQGEETREAEQGNEAREIERGEESRNDEQGTAEETQAPNNRPREQEEKVETPKPSEEKAFVYTYPSSVYTQYTAAAAKANVNVRKGAGTSYAALTLLAAGRSLPYLWEESGWYAVWTGERVGYLSKRYAYLTKTNQAIERVISAGLEKLGTPYEWGAPRVLGAGGKENPYFTGKSFDCSSFIQYCFYEGCGVKLGDYTGSQADHTVGKTISDYASLMRGDVFFTGTNGKISHVVLYLGGGRLLQCYSSNGGPVSLTSDENWKAKFISGRRVDLTVTDQFC